MMPDKEQIRLIQDIVEKIILQSEAPLTEHSLIKEIDKQGLFSGIVGEDATLALFRKHFLVMHVLYRLQPLFLERGKHLSINVLEIQLLSESGNKDSAPAMPDPGLRNYYSDLEEFSEVTGADVVNLLHGFWQTFERWQSAEKSYEILGLKPEASWLEVQTAYRRAVAKAHPDKGGDETAFRRIFEAYQSLKLRLKPSASGDRPGN